MAVSCPQHLQNKKHLLIKNASFNTNKNLLIQIKKFFNTNEKQNKKHLLIQEQQPEINVDNFSTPLYLFNT